MNTKSEQHPADKPARQGGRVRRFLRANKAVSALEYAILVGVIAVGIGGALATFNTEITNALKNAGKQIGSITGLKAAT